MVGGGWPGGEKAATLPTTHDLPMEGLGAWGKRERERERPAGGAQRRVLPPNWVSREDPGAGEQEAEERPEQVGLH